MRYETELLDIRERLDKLSASSEVINILKDEHQQRKVWNEKLNELSNDIINSHIDCESKDYFLKSLSKYKKSLKEIETTQNSFGKYIPYLISAGIGLFLGYKLKGVVESGTYKIAIDAIKGFNEEMKNNV